MKRSTVSIRIELEGPTVDGQSFRDWLLEAEPEARWPQDQFRIVQVEVLSEDD